MHRSFHPGQRGKRARKSAPDLPLVPFPTRKPLPEMDAAELLDWLTRQSTDLRAFQHYIQRYLKRRADDGRQTDTDLRYRAFLTQSVDLLAGLEEWRTALAAECQEE